MWSGLLGRDPTGDALVVETVAARGHGKLVFDDKGVK
jgi:hypothetical protein